MRQILFLAHRFHVINVEHNPKNLALNDREHELYLEIKSELIQYGVLTSEKTSGTRLKVPSPEVMASLDAETLVENPAQHPSTLDAIDRAVFERREMQRRLLSSVDSADYIVAAVDSENETRGSLVEYAHQKRKNILLLQQETPIHLPTRPLYYDRPGITYVVYGNTSEMKMAIRRFFNAHPAVGIAG